MKTVLLFLLALPLLAQNPSNQDLDVLGHFNMAAGTYSAPFIPVSADPTGACTVAGSVVINTTTGQLTGCVALIWTPLGGAGSGNVSGPGSSTNFALAAWNGTTGLVLRDTSVITDGSGNLTATSLTTSGGGAGSLSLTQGTLGSFPSNSVALVAPTSVPTAYHWTFPSADASGCISSDGSGHLSIASCAAGSVTSVALTAPSWFSVAGSPITGSGTLAVTAATGQTSHKVIGTCGSGTSFAPCSLVTGDLPSSVLIRPCEITVGDPGANSSALANDNDSPAVCGNVYGATLTVTAVECYADAGSPIITPIITGGGSTSILSGALTCGTGSFASGTLNGTPTQSTSGTIDANITTAGGTAKYIVIRITRTL